MKNTWIIPGSWTSSVPFSLPYPLPKMKNMEVSAGKENPMIGDVIR